MRWPLVSLCVVIAMAPTVAGAESFYRYINRQGGVVYQDQPPPPGARDVVVVSVASGTDTPQRQAGAANRTVILYSIPQCPPCESVKSYLTSHEVPFEELDVAADPKAKKQMQKTTGYASVPTLSVGDDSMNGFDPTWLAAELKKAGYGASPNGGQGSGAATP